MKHLKAFENLYTGDFVTKLHNLNKEGYYKVGLNIKAAGHINLDNFNTVEKFITDLYKGAEFYKNNKYFSIVKFKERININIAELEDEYFYVFIHDYQNKSPLKNFTCDQVDGLKYLMVDLKKLLDSI
jgi:hypothetical protein